MDDATELLLQAWLQDWLANPESFALAACRRGAELAQAWPLEAAAPSGAVPAAAASDSPSAMLPAASPAGVTDWLARATGAALVTRGWRVATAESCTGGGLGAALTAIGGSSAWVEGGCITYSNAAKTALLGVPEALLQAHGAVSQAVAEAMAQGARQRLGCECAVAITGVAGPTGGSAHKPVGTVWLAWAGPDGRLSSHGLWFPGDRAAVRLGAVWVGLTGVLALARARAFSAHDAGAGVA